MSDKYYFPKIEEFYIGFEYEYQEDRNNDIWKPHVWDNMFVTIGSMVFFTEGLLNYNLARVKYLDEDDIKELGWKPTDKKGPFGEVVFEYKKEGFGFNEIDTWNLLVNPQFFHNPTSTSAVTLKHKYESSWAGTNDTLQGFTLKNKGELKKLMQWLRII